MVSTAYEGKVNVWMTKWDDAVVAFEDVEKNAGYDLEPTMKIYLP
jgi:hypothetical protein